MFKFVCQNLGHFTLFFFALVQVGLNESFDIKIAKQVHGGMICTHICVVNDNNNKDNDNTNNDDDDDDTTKSTCI